MQNSGRIKVLDSFRFIAILMVIFYHYFSSWTLPEFQANYYPYGGALRDYFQYGFMGVQFFFIISGFVIFYTIESSISFLDFMIKRYLRLFPSMLFCSIITYCFVRLFDQQNSFPVFHSKTVLDFLPSLTFTTPQIWNILFHTDRIYFVCGVYWSLWVEMTFYFCMGIIYFLSKKKFLINWSLFVSATIVLRLLQSPNIKINLIFIRDLYSIINFFRYTSYFTFGIYFYSIYSKKQIPFLFHVLSFVLFVLELIKLETATQRIIYCVIVSLFLVFLYLPIMIKFLEHRFFYSIGLSSYVLYLLHEYLGIIIINKLASYDFFGRYWLIPPLLTIIFIILLSYLISKYFEVPTARYLKQLYRLAIEKNVFRNKLSSKKPI